jgi:hypothetical protein
VSTIRYREAPADLGHREVHVSLTALPLTAPLLARTSDEIRAEVGHALAARDRLLERVDPRDMPEAERITWHVAAYQWLLGETDVAPYTGRRVAAATIRDLAIEQSLGRDHAEQNTHRYNDPERLPAEAVFDAIAWARGEFDDPPSLRW